MKRVLSSLLILALMLSLTSAAFADVWAAPNTKIATRTGPSTNYIEPGTFYANGPVRIVSYAWDQRNEIYWLQCEIDQGYGKMRVYTGEWRFGSVDHYALKNENTYTTYKSNLRYEYHVKCGPGYDYANMMSPTGYAISPVAGKNVTILTSEYDDWGNEWCQIEFIWRGNWDGEYCRAWVPANLVK